LDENRDYPDASLEGGGDFEPHEIPRVIQPPSALVRASQPLSPDDNEQDLTRADGIFDVFDEVSTRFNALNVDENNLRAEMCSQLIGQAPGVRRAFRPAVTDEDFRRVSP
jgi:hypothetical protein